MVEFGIKTEHSPEVDDLIQTIRENLQHYDTLKQPFTGDITRHKIANIEVIQESHKEPNTKLRIEMIYKVSITPVLPRVYWIGIVFLIADYLFIGSHWSLWYLPGILISMTFIFWTPQFWYMLFKLSMKKHKLSSTTTYVCSRDMLQLITVSSIHTKL
jgi:hypothetical protein